MCFGLLFAQGTYFIGERLNLTCEIFLFLIGNMSLDVPVGDPHSFLMLIFERRPKSGVKVCEGIIRRISPKGGKNEIVAKARKPMENKSTVMVGGRRAESHSYRLALHGEWKH